MPSGRHEVEGFSQAAWVGEGGGVGLRGSGGEANQIAGGVQLRRCGAAVEEGLMVGFAMKGAKGSGASG